MPTNTKPSDVQRAQRTTNKWNNNFISVLIRPNMCKALNSYKTRMERKKSAMIFAKGKLYHQKQQKQL